MMRCLVVLACLGSAACFGGASQARRFYVLNIEPVASPPSSPITGLVRVRNMDAESTYDKFQIVVRQNPFELEYRELDVWAVKPGRMVSDLIARTLLDTSTFESVTRELGERRPDYVLSGDLHAIEIYDSDDTWYAHLSISLSLTRFDSGEPLWTASFDERKQVPTKTFAHAIRALSELLTQATERAIGGIRVAMTKREGGAVAQEDSSEVAGEVTPGTAPAVITPDVAPRQEAPATPVMIPDRPR